MRHREAWAVEARAPSASQWAAEQSNNGENPHKPAAVTPAAKTAARPVVSRPVAAELERDILIVASKLKKYIKAKSGMNTSESVLDPLSDYVRALCDKAIRVAGTDGRKTVMGRDIRAASKP